MVTLPAITPSTTPTAEEIHQGLLYGRLTAVDGATYEGRLRWGRDQEAFWGDYFNGSKNETLEISSTRILSGQMEISYASHRNRKGW